MKLTMSIDQVIKQFDSDTIIILSPSKTFNNTEPTSNGERPHFINDAKKIFSKIKDFNLEDTKLKYSLSDKKALQVFDMHANHGKKMYHAKDLFGGLVFKQINLSDEQWIKLNDNVLILDALYGVIKPMDTISEYRLDLKTNFPIDLKKLWTPKINDLLINKKIINLASVEFSSLLNCEMLNIELDPMVKQIKVSRGLTFNKLAHAILKKFH